MQKVDVDNTLGTIKIYDTFDMMAPLGDANETPRLNYPGEEYVISLINLENIKNFRFFNYESLGLNDTRYLNQYYRISRDGVNWSEWLILNRMIDNFPSHDPIKPFYMDIKWVRMGSSEIGSIRILEYLLEGEVSRREESFDSIPQGTFIEVKAGESKIIPINDIFKVFSISDLDISTKNPLENNQVIKYRFTQDSKKTWSEWELLNKENIISKRINPIRFFMIEYLIENNSSNDIYVGNIEIIGDVQNVTKDYQKTNRLGLRECCPSNIFGHFDANGNFIAPDNYNTTGLGESCDADVFKPMSDQEKANLYNPYAQSTASKLLEKLSADTEQFLGHKITYFVTDPDENGQDHTLNEYQLYNIVCQGDLKVSIEGNNFPDSQIKMNMFDLDLFDTMEAHITKQQFKEIFGKQRRPSKEDFMYFCDLNRMFQVDHAQQYRNFNNQSVYYKVILKKYTQKANVIPDNPQIKNTLETLTDNTTIRELMGDYQESDKLSTANKDQMQTLSTDKVRLEYLAEINKELIENSTVIISKSNYDLASVDYRSQAVKYKNLSPATKVSDNIGFIAWFNMYNYVKDEYYNFFKYYDEENSLGWKAELINDKIELTINSTKYEYNLKGYESDENNALDEEVWYCYVLNVDQRNKEITQYIYKRNVEFEEEAVDLTSSKLLKVYDNKINMTDSHEFHIYETPTILGSDMKMTNIRLFVDVIPENTHNKILNQYVIGNDSRYLIFADNANTRIYLNRFPYNE